MHTVIQDQGLKKCKFCNGSQSPTNVTTVQPTGRDVEPTKIILLFAAPKRPSNVILNRTLPLTTPQMLENDGLFIDIVKVNSSNLSAERNDGNIPTPQSIPTDASENVSQLMTPNRTDLSH